MTQDAIEVINVMRKFLDANGPLAATLFDHLTASGFIIMTTAERDGIRAAAMAEARSKIWAGVEGGFSAWKAKPHNDKWWRKIDGTPIQNDLTVNIIEAVQTAILALAKTPPGMVCVPVEPSEAMIHDGVNALSKLSRWATSKQVANVYRAMIDV